MGDVGHRVDTRQSNMELLRVIAMLGVILLHYNVTGMGNAFELTSVRANSLLLQSLEAVYAWPVDAFMMLSGYFMCTKKSVDIKKPVALLAELVFFQLVFEFAGSMMRQETLSAKLLLMKLVPANYFVILYVAVYIFSPFINRFLSGLSAAQCKKLLVLLVAVFSVWPYAVELLERSMLYPLGQASTISSMGTQNGYNITNFALCYVIGATLRKNVVELKKPLLLYAAATLGVVCTAVVFGIYTAVEYCSPFVILQAAALIRLFECVNIPHSKVINKLAEASFTIYLTHTVLYSYCMVEKFANSSMLVLLTHVIACQIVIYLVCFEVFVVYDALTRPLFNRLWSRVKAPRIDLEVA